jgi:hypothetical protein
LTLKDAQMSLRRGRRGGHHARRPHWFANDGRKPAVAFVVYTPALAGLPTSCRSARR